MGESIVQEKGAGTIPLKLIADGSRRWDLTLAEIAEFAFVLCDCGISCEQCDQAQ